MIFPAAAHLDTHIQITNTSWPEVALQRREQSVLVPVIAEAGREYSTNAPADRAGAAGCAEWRGRGAPAATAAAADELVEGRPKAGVEGPGAAGRE